MITVACDGSQYGMAELLETLNLLWVPEYPPRKFFSISRKIFISEINFRLTLASLSIVENDRLGMETN